MTLLLTLLACADPSFDGHLEVDLSGETPVFLLQDLSDDGPNGLSVDRCTSSDGAEASWEIRGAALPETLDYGALTDGLNEVFAPLPLEEGALYAASAATWTGLGLHNSWSTADWNVSFVAGDPDSVQLGTWCGDAW